MIEVLFTFYRLEDVCLRLGDKLGDSPLRLVDMVDFFAKQIFIITIR